MDMYTSHDRIWSTHQSQPTAEGYFTKRLPKKNFQCTKLHICIVTTLLVLILTLICLIPVYLNIAADKEVVSEFDTLVEYRLQLEADINMWKRNNGSTGTIEHITQHGYLMQEMVYKLADMSQVDLPELQSSSAHQKLFHDIVGDVCSSTMTSCSSSVTSSGYRTIDGRCNNMRYPEWGMGATIYRRDLPPAYSDGIGSPRMYGVDGAPLPSPRTVSNVVHQSRTDRRIDTRSTVMVMAFGQFLSHDIVSTPTTDGAHTSKLNCCDEPGSLSGPFKACFNVEMDYTDEFFGNAKCMKFTRSAPAPCTKCGICGREQMNEVTSYIDASNVYGSSEIREKSLRRFRNGLLLVNETTNLLPWQPTRMCNGRQPFCFAAGDMRVTVVPNLSTLHIIFVRLHNLLAGRLLAINSDWSDEIIYQETRKIVIAIMQNIVYAEYLPAILAPETRRKYDLDLADDFRFVYNGNTDAGASNAFSTAAFRYGHATVPDTQVLLDVEYKIQHIANIEDTFHNPNLTVNSCSGLARWMVHHNGVSSDGMFSKGVRNLLFIDRTKHVSFDLLALNIQRGRDHGIPSYNKWREYCQLPVITESQFEQSGTGMGDFTSQVADKFRQTYSHPDDIDLFSGGVMENVLQDSQVGPTFSCILGDNFSRFKTGDRFFFENPDHRTGFNLEQLKSIKRLSFSKVICEAMSIDRIPANVFIPTSGQMSDCSALEDLDMTLWKADRAP